MRESKKNKHAVALGKLGGMVGGKSRSKAKGIAARQNGKRGGRPANVLAKTVRLANG